MNAPLSEVRLRRCAEQIYELGPRPLYELLKELQHGADVSARIERYAAIDPDLVHALGGDRFPPLTWSIDGGRL